MKRNSWMLAVVLACSLGAFAQDAGNIFVVRHSEKVSETADALSAAGQTRANCLALTLRDTNIKTVITSPTQRARQTAEPTANEFKIKSEDTQADNFTAIAARAREASKQGDVLIIGHSNTIPQIVKELTGAQVLVEDIAYDKMFVVSGAKTIMLRYCPATTPVKDTMMPK
jgi:phosphohistidine phosphatase SixA